MKRCHINLKYKPLISGNYIVYMPIFYTPNELSFTSQDILFFLSETLLLFYPGVNKHCLSPSKSSTGHSPQKYLFMVHKIWITFSCLFPW